MVSIIG